MNISDIADDNQSGAGEILAKACQLIDQDLANGIRPDRGTLLQLINAQPRMATIFNLVNFVLYELKSPLPARPDWKPGERFLRQYKAAEEKIVKQLTKLLSGYSRIFTYSRSSLVMKALVKLKQPELRTVFLCEGRPACEGRVAATQLAERRIRVRYMVDAAMAAGVEKAELVLVGADSFSPDYFINKIGTFPLALLCREHARPFFVACPTQKFLPDLAMLPSEQPHPGEEVWAEPKGVDVLNYYFEIVPANLATAFFTESGILNPAQLAELGKSLQLYDNL